MFSQLLLLTLTAQNLFLRGIPIKVQAAPCDEPKYCFSPKGPATLCLGEGPAQTCYTAPGDHGRDPEVELIQIDKETQAILFQASGSGASDYPIHFALLLQAASGKLENIFPSTLTLPSQSQHRFFNDPNLSARPIFVTADYHWGLNDTHHGTHRFFISVYLLQKDLDGGTYRYTLADRFMTIKRYGVIDSDDDILTAEAPEWKSRLHRVLANTPPTESENRGFTYYLTGSPANAPTPQPTKPGYLLAGGGKDQDAAFLWFLERANHGDMLILRGSGADGYHPYLSKLSPKLDSIESIVFQEAKSTSAPFVLERIRQADAIFLAGGNQWNYERLWRNTPVQRELNAAIKRGIPIGGTSAGLAVLSEFGFTAQHGGITSEEAQANPNQPKIAIERGLLNIPALTCLITDSHFTQRKREGRLRVFLKNIEATNQCQQPPIGLGIDERTALLLEPDGTGTVVGEGAVHLYANPKAQPISIRAKETLNLKQFRPQAPATNP